MCRWKVGKEILSYALIPPRAWDQLSVVVSVSGSDIGPGTIFLQVVRLERTNRKVNIGTVCGQCHVEWLWSAVYSCYKTSFTMTTRSRRLIEIDTRVVFINTSSPGDTWSFSIANTNPTPAEPTVKRIQFVRIILHFFIKYIEIIEIYLSLLSTCTKTARLL